MEKYKGYMTLWNGHGAFSYLRTLLIKVKPKVQHRKVVSNQSDAGYYNNKQNIQYSSRPPTVIGVEGRDASEYCLRYNSSLQAHSW